MDQRKFAAVAWAALSEVDNHFAKLGGQNRYAGYDDTHAAVFVVALLAANMPGLAARLTPAAEGLRAAIDALEPEAKHLCRMVHSVEPWNPERFPDEVFGVAHRLLVECRPTQDDLLDFENALNRRWSSLTTRDRDTFSSAFQDLATLFSARQRR